MCQALTMNLTNIKFLVLKEPSEVGIITPILYRKKLQLGDFNRTVPF